MEAPAAEATAAETPAAEAEAAPRLTAKEKREAAGAFSDRLNATPAKCSEADRYRVADDRFRALSAAAFASVRVACDGANDSELPPEIAATFECWCIIHGEKASVATCGKLAAEPDDFKLVGSSTVNCLSAEELSEIERRVASLDSAAVAERPIACAEATSAMLEWAQAAVALQRWAEAKRLEPEE